jgi:exosome complex component RRP4
MGELKTQENEIVVPGEVVAEGMDFLPSNGTYRLKEKILAKKLGILRTEGKVIKLIPLSGRYLPKKNDTIIGKVTDVNLNGWIVDTNSAYHAMLPLKDATNEFIRRGANLTKIYDINDYIVTQITNVTSQNLVDLSMKDQGLRKLREGRIIYINPHKVPRVIGKQGSMVSMIKQATNCQITVGQNGVIWLSGEPEGEILAERAIKKIEAESHISGLTDKIQKFLDDNKLKQESKKEETKKAETDEKVKK